MKQRTWIYGYREQLSRGKKIKQQIQENYFLDTFGMRESEF